jgi:endonuclease/exonuclease/phosphatase (EEP) superfamily protein YafD
LSPVVKNLALESIACSRNLLSSGSRQEVVATHPSSPQTKEQFLARNQQLDNLAEYLAGSTAPLIMGGDFNVSMWSPFYRKFVEKSRIHNARQGFGVIPTWSSMKIKALPEFLQPWLSVPIDYIFTRSGKKFGLHPISMKAGRYVGSDHLPVIAEIGAVDKVY